jgi:hypothetical protein
MLIELTSKKKIYARTPDAAIFSRFKSNDGKMTAGEPVN